MAKNEVDLQIEFAFMLGEFLVWCRDSGHGVTLGEAYRDRSRAIKGSYHPRRLAIDLNLFVDGVYKRATEDYIVLGLKWESLGGTWGGRFTRADGNHFSFGE